MKAIVDAEVRRPECEKAFCAAVTMLFRLRPGVTVSSHSSSPTVVTFDKVCDALLEGSASRISDFAQPRTRRCGVSLGVDVFDEQRIESVAQLVDQVELVDNAVGVAADHHVERLVSR